MTDIDPRILDEAIAWHLRTADMDEAAWPLFVAWLEAAPDHARAYDVVSHADAGRHIAMPRAANDDDGAGGVMRARAGAGRWWRWSGGLAAVAAAAVAGVALHDTAQAPGAPTAIAAETSRQITLRDGTQVALEAGARLGLSRDDPRAVRLERGRATFSVRHDAAHPFTLQVGDARLEDVGTVFTVTRTPGGADLTVSEGAVRFVSARARVPVAAGEGLTILADDRGAPIRSTLDADGARTLRFDARTVAVAARALGMVSRDAVQVTPQVESLPFTGVVRLTGDAAQDMAHLGALTGTRVSHGAQGWIFAPAAGLP